MFSVARFGENNRPVFVKRVLRGGKAREGEPEEVWHEDTGNAQQAQMFSTLEEADRTAKELGNGWFPVAWK